MYCKVGFVVLDNEAASVTTALEETLFEVVDVSACVSAHDQLVKSARFHQHG